MARPKCKFCKEKISIFETYLDYDDGFVHESCHTDAINKIIKRSQIKPYASESKK